MEHTIPVLSLREWYRIPHLFSEKAGDALRDVGFFSLIDHGIETSLIEQAFNVNEKFFSLSEDQKKKFENPTLRGQRGFVSFGKESAKNNDLFDLKEFYHVGREIPVGFNASPSESIYAENIWPTEYVSTYQPIMSALFQEMDRLSSMVLEALALYLGEEQDLIADMIKGGDSLLRAIHYPPLTSDDTMGHIRAAAHEDINLITLLCESSEPGLELLAPDGQWIPIHRLQGQIIVNSSDMLKNLTGGLFKSTTHRVVNPKGDTSKPRYSMPFFAHPRGEVSLKPLSTAGQKLDHLGRKPSGRDISARQFLNERLAELGL